MRNYKQIPSVPTLIASYFQNPGFTLAHIYMQDGNLNSLNEHVAVPRLHVGTRSKWSMVRLCFAIYKITGLKFFVTENTLNTRGPEVANNYIWAAYLSPECVEKFRELTLPYMIPCFYYKIPPGLGDKKLSAEYVARFDQYFQESVLKYKDVF